MSSYTKVGNLSSARQELLRLAQRMGCGRIRNLPVRQGQPILSPEPEVLLEPGAKMKERRRQYPLEFGELPGEVQMLMVLFDHLHDGELDIKVTDGVPSWSSAHDTETYRVDLRLEQGQMERWFAEGLTGKEIAGKLREKLLELDKLESQYGDPKRVPIHPELLKSLESSSLKFKDPDHPERGWILEPDEE